MPSEKETAVIVGTFAVAFGVFLTLFFLIKSDGPHKKITVDTSPVTHERFVIPDAIRILGPESPQPFSSKLNNATENNYILFEMDCAGINNVWMAFEIAIGLSWIYGRTLLIPPASKIDHMEKALHIFEIFDEGAISGHIQLEDTLTHFKASTQEECKNLAMIHGVHGNINPELHTYEVGRQFKDVRYWLLGNCDGARLFGHVSCFFKEQAPPVYHLLRRAMRLNPNIIKGATRIAKEMGITHDGGAYASVHMRRGDFGQVIRALPKTRQFAQASLKLMQGHHPFVVLLTDGTAEEISDFKKEIPIPVKVVPSQKGNLTCVSEMLIAACAATFVGTAFSTFSTRIANLRGLMSHDFPLKETRFVGEEFLPVEREKTCWWLVDSESWAYRK